LGGARGDDTQIHLAATFYLAKASLLPLCATAFFALERWSAGASPSSARRRDAEFRFYLRGRDVALHDRHVRQGIAHAVRRLGVIAVSLNFSRIEVR
jgi:hypothetical protein